MIAHPPLPSRPHACHVLEVAFGPALQRDGCAVRLGFACVAWIKIF